MLSIDEAIAKYKEITNTDANCPAHCNISCDKCVQESRQLSEWLEELKEYQEISKKNPFLVDMIKHDKIVRNKAIDDFKKELVKESHYLEGHYGAIYEEDVYKIAEQLKAGGENG